VQGAVAQLVAHHTGSVGVRGSSPLSSTRLGLECVDGKRRPIQPRFVLLAFGLARRGLRHRTPAAATRPPARGWAGRWLRRPARCRPAHNLAGRRFRYPLRLSPVNPTPAWLNGAWLRQPVPSRSSTDSTRRASLAGSSVGGWPSLPDQSLRRSVHRHNDQHTPRSIGVPVSPVGPLASSPITSARWPRARSRPTGAAAPVADQTRHRDGFQAP
jgi:hypothetical protein